VGWAAGVDRLVLLREEKGLTAGPSAPGIRIIGGFGDEVRAP